MSAPAYILLNKMQTEMKYRLLFLCLLLASCSTWTPREKEIIDSSDSLMYVYQLPKDSAVLRTVSRDFGPDLIGSARIGRLSTFMLHTVKDPSQDGVGIAAPQVGINRRMVCVQRFDKPGEPFECYANIRIDSLYGPVVQGPEGCLSVPGKRGIVPRWSRVDISYVDPETGVHASETVDGFTAIIFQHECDHLDGVMYIDKADTVFAK